LRYVWHKLLTINYVGLCMMSVYTEQLVRLFLLYRDNEFVQRMFNPFVWWMKTVCLHHILFTLLAACQCFTPVALWQGWKSGSCSPAKF